jgi:hypothetical protein
MSEFSPSDAALEGFRLVRERPGTILAWGGLYFVGIVGIGAFMLAAIGKDFVEYVQRGGMESGDVEALVAMLQHAWPAFLAILLLVIFLGSIINAGVYRLVLRPDEPGFVHLRIGADELRLTLVNVLLFSLGMVFLFLLAMVAAVLTAGQGALSAVIALLVAAVMVWIGVRLLLATPMTFGERRVIVRESWRLTQGRFWSLFGMTLLAVTFYLMVWLLFSIISAAFIALAGGPEAVANPAELRGFAIVAFLVTMLIQLLLPVLQIIMIYAPLAMAYRQLRHADEAPPQALPQT